MKIRTEVEITCEVEECENKAWAKTVFELNDEVTVNRVPGTIEVVEEYSQESHPPSGWANIKRKSPHSDYVFTLLVCRDCFQ